MQAKPQTLPAITLPAIGAATHGGKFAGILTGNDGVPYALILLADKPADDAGPNGDGDLPWRAAMDWAQKGLGADLPTRPEAALLFQLLKPEFEERWHWTNETCAWSTSSAWHQYFDYGYQFSYDESSAGRCRAVRRLPLHSFSPLTDGNAITQASESALA